MGLHEKMELASILAQDTDYVNAYKDTFEERFFRLQQQETCISTMTKSLVEVAQNYVKSTIYVDAGNIVRLYEGYEVPKSIGRENVRVGYDTFLSWLLGQHVPLFEYDWNSRGELHFKIYEPVFSNFKNEKEQVKEILNAVPRNLFTLSYK